MQILNRSVKHYNRDNIFIYKTKNLYAYRNYLNDVIATPYERIGVRHIDIKFFLFFCNS